MAKGSFDLSSNSSVQWAWVTYSEGNIDTDNNTSSLTVNVYFRRSNNGWTSSGTMSTSVTVDGVKKSESKAFSNSGTSDSLVFSQTFTNIKHNADGSKSVSISVTATGNQGFSGSGSSTVALDNIARAAYITAAPNFNDEENPTISYKNPLGNDSGVKVEACIALYDSVSGYWLDTLGAYYREISKTGTSYTFNLTEEERTRLRNGVTNGYTRQVAFYIRTTVDGKIYYSTSTKTLTLINAEPIVAPIVYDSNPVTQTLVGNNSQRFIYGESNLYYDIGAEGRKGATITSCNVKCGSYNSNTPTGTINNILPGYGEDYVAFSATDSRGNTVTSYVTLDVVWYMRPECYLEEDSLSTSSGNLYFNVRCYWFDGYFDGTTNGSDGGVKNEANLQYRYRLEDGEYGEWISADSSGISYDPEYFIQNSFNEYMWKVAISGLDYTSTYKVQLRILDKATTSDIAVISEEHTMNMIPVFDWSREDFAVNVPTHLNDGLYLLDNEGNYSEVMRYADNGPDAGYGLNIGYDNFSKAMNSEASADEFQYDTTLHGNNVKITPVNDLYLTPTYGQVYINFNPLNDFVIEQGTSGNWYYRKWNSGIAEMWGWCQPTYQASHYLSSYQPFPITLLTWISAIGTVNGFSGNLASYLGVNVKIECFTTGCNVWVQNPNNSFTSGQSTSVSIHVIGKWRGPDGEVWG